VAILSRNRCKVTTEKKSIDEFPHLSKLNSHAQSRHISRNNALLSNEFPHESHVPVIAQPWAFWRSTGMLPSRICELYAVLSRPTRSRLEQLSNYLFFQLAISPRVFSTELHSHSISLTFLFLSNSKYLFSPYLCWKRGFDTALTEP
jgi:hypothetical protein